MLWKIKKCRFLFRLNDFFIELICLHKKWGDDLATIALNICALPKKNSEKQRIVVITNASEPTIVATAGAVTTYPVPPLAEELLVDACGAGDAFVGGFLARLATGNSIDECVKAGHYAARIIIQKSGCDVPSE